MENSEENIKLRAVTGGCFHRSSFVYHIEYGGIYYQYTIHHINAKTLNLRLVKTNLMIYSDFQWNLSCLRYRNKGCPATLTLGFNDSISKYIDCNERTYGKRTMIIMKFQSTAYSSPEVRNVENYWVLNGNLTHWSGCTIDPDDTNTANIYSESINNLLKSILK